jgi:hypothetical protein
MAGGNKKLGCCLVPRLSCCLTILVLVVCLLPMGIVYYAVSGGPEPIDPDFVATEADAQLYEKAYAVALRQASTSARFQLSIPDEEFASWLTLNFREEIAKELGIESAADRMTFQVKFEDSEAKIFVQTKVGGGIHMNSLAVITIAPPTATTPAGQPLDIQVKSLQLGRFNGNEQFEEDLGKAINNALTQQLASIEGRYTIDSVSLNNGVLAFGGRVASRPQ